MTFTLTSTLDDMDLDWVHLQIADTYWAKGIPRETFNKSLKNSLCFGLIDDNGRQVAFARVISDYATFAYLGDVFVDENERGNGLSRKLMDAVDTHPELQGLRRFMLATSDAHGLYEKYGFTAVPNPDILMQKWDPNIYQK